MGSPYKRNSEFLANKERMIKIIKHDPDIKPFQLKARFGLSSSCITRILREIREDANKTT